jgi:hypothetical protein
MSHTVLDDASAEQVDVDGTDLLAAGGKIDTNRESRALPPDLNPSARVVAAYQRGDVALKTGGDSGATAEGLRAENLEFFGQGRSEFIDGHLGSTPSI